MEYSNYSINLNCNFYFWILPIFNDMFCQVTDDTFILVVSGLTKIILKITTSCLFKTDIKSNLSLFKKDYLQKDIKTFKYFTSLIRLIFSFLLLIFDGLTQQYFEGLFGCNFHYLKVFRVVQ